jgi:uncharacterized protein (DUF302 family)
MPDFEYTVQSEKSFDEAVAAVEAQARELGFGVLHVHDVQATLAAKGFEREPLKIIEVCNARHAHAVLAREIRAALMLPCPVCVYVEAGATVVSALRPLAMVEMYPEADLGEIAAEVEAAIVAMVDAAR